MKLKPCPFCGNANPEFIRHGDRRQSCIVACGNCGCRHESGDQDEYNGDSWNRRPSEDDFAAKLEALDARVAALESARDYDETHAREQNERS